MVSVSASIGVAIYPQDAVESDLLLRLADQAMYNAKQRGRSQYIFSGNVKDGIG
jgi:diguanylate cyclase (GGDEF)-like protein